MAAIAHLFVLTAPLFLLVLVGYGSMRWGKWEQGVASGLTRFVFVVAIPALLFRLMIDFARLPAVDVRLLVAYFGGSLLVYAMARVFARRAFAMDGVAQSIFGLGGIFSNNLLLGLPLAKTLLGDASVPVVSLVLVFNSFLLWMLVTVSVEWARNRTASLGGFLATAKSVLANPIVASIVAGTAYGFLGVPLPTVIERTFDLMGQAAVPLSLIALGMGLAEYGIRQGVRTSVAVCVFKLVVHPLVVAAAAVALRLPPLETQVIALLAGLPVGANVYLMARQFNSLSGPVAGSLVLSTAVAAVTAPLLLAAIVALFA